MGSNFRLGFDPTHPKIIYLLIAAVNCDESGTIVAGSCNECPYELFMSSEMSNYYHYYESFYNDGTYCKGDCYWNSGLDECQMPGILLISVSLQFIIDKLSQGRPSSLYTCIVCFLALKF